jgi:hypothetical protein
LNLQYQSKTRDAHQARINADLREVVAILAEEMLRSERRRHNTPADSSVVPPGDTGGGAGTRNPDPDADSHTQADAEVGAERASATTAATEEKCG